MIDLFHLQLIKGNITNTLNDLKSHIGHVQVSGIRWCSLFSLSQSHNLSVSGVWNTTTHMRSKFQNGGEKAINFRTIFNFFSLILLSFFFSFPLFDYHFPPSHTLTVLCIRFDGGVLYCWSCQFLWHFCCICSLNSCAFVPTCLLFLFSLLCAGDVKMNLCNVYLLYQHSHLSTCIRKCIRIILALGRLAVNFCLI